MRSSAQLRGAATAWGAVACAALFVAVATFPYGVLRSASRYTQAAATYATPPQNEIVEAPPEQPPDQVVGVAVPSSQTEIWFADSNRLIRLGGIYPIRPEDTSFLANNRSAYAQIFSGQTLQCVTSNSGETFRCQNAKGEDVANILVSRGLASYREVAATNTVSAAVPVSSQNTAMGPEQFLEASNIRWRRRPSERDFARRYPHAALEAGQGGRVVLSCLIQQGGDLSCEVSEEEPSDAGFGEAARELSGEFRAAPRTEDGLQTAGRHVRLSLVFRPGD